MGDLAIEAWLDQCLANFVGRAGQASTCGAQDSRSRDACVHIRFTIDKYGCGPPELSSWTLPGNLHESLEPCAPKLSGLRDASPTLIVSSSPPHSSSNLHGVLLDYL